MAQSLKCHIDALVNLVFEVVPWYFRCHLQAISSISVLANVNELLTSAWAALALSDLEQMDIM